LLEQLDGLPLAIAQAGAFLQETAVNLTDYLQFYEQEWSRLMESGSVTDAPLQDYPDRSVWTTWAISYKAVREKHEATANLLLLWSFLDNKDLWHGMFAAACQNSNVAARMLAKWIGDIASSKLEFSRAMQLLRNYSLIEEMEGLTSYATHPVVHRWAYHYQGKHSASELGRLAVVTVGWAVPVRSTRDYWVMERRLLPHVQAGPRWVENSCKKQSIQGDRSCNTDIDRGEEQQTLLDAIQLLGSLYWNQGKLGEAEQMYNRALQGTEKALGPNHTSTLGTVNNLGILYRGQGKLDKAEQMYNRALQGSEKALGPNHTLTLEIVNNLGVLYGKQGKLDKAEQMYSRALQGIEKALGPNHTSTLDTVNNLGSLYADQGKLDKAEQMYSRALQGIEKALGPNHTSTLNTVNNLGLLYQDQGKLGEAEQMYNRALRGYEEALGNESLQTYQPALNTMENVADLYADQGQYASAQAMYSRALSGVQNVLGHSSDQCQEIVAKMDALPNFREEAEEESMSAGNGSELAEDESELAEDESRSAEPEASEAKGKRRGNLRLAMRNLRERFRK